MKRILVCSLFATLLASSCSLLKKTEPAPPPPSTAARTGASTDRNQVYADQYQAAAMYEMQTMGVPASITLAQGILESGAGTSELAKNANNHFGIKCGNNWSGATYMKKDDDRDASGNLKESCFRKYVKVEESYVDHAQFLRDPKKEQRYGFLFKLDPTDYKGWAHGLQSSGYSTSNTYADKLIDIIERYRLYDYDVPGGKAASTVPNPENPAAAATGAAIPLQTATNRVGRINNVKLVVAREGESINDIAKSYRLSGEKIAEYNDRGYTPIQKLKANTRVFIQSKKDKWSGSSANEHVVASNQTMFDISQLYGVKLNKLLERNFMSRGQEPAEGQRISLNTKRSAEDPVQLRDASAVVNSAGNYPPPPSSVTMTPDDEGVLDEISGGEAGKPQAAAAATSATVPPSGAPMPAVTTTPSVTGTQPGSTTTPVTTAPQAWGAQTPATTTNPSVAPPPAAGTQPETTPPPYAAPPKPAPVVTGQSNYPPVTTTPNPNDQPDFTKPPAPAPGTHVVGKGDTLTNIAKRYNISVAKLMELNGLKDGNIKIGQTLKVK